MSVVLFVIIVVVLVVGHEAGHFAAAKLFRMRVPEFGFGFPPKLWGMTIGGTEYSLNALPFGGFVRIHGEGEEASDPGSFSAKPRPAQALTLAAGPFMNIVLAFFLFFLAFLGGVPAALDSGYPANDIKDARITVTEVLPGSPGERAGIRPGDEVVSASVAGVETPITAPADLVERVRAAAGPLTLTVARAGTSRSFILTPVAGIVPGAPERLAIGIATDAVGTLRLSFGDAVKAAFQRTADAVEGTVVGIGTVIGKAFSGNDALSGVTGPVGILFLTGDAARFGFGAVLSFAALISTSLGVLNLFPFPALDGGRLVFLLFESVAGKRVPGRYASALNAVGLAFLFLIVIVVTAHDITSRLAG